MSTTLMASATARRLDPGKFRDPLRTASGERRARVALKSLDTLWFNTGTLCNLTCEHCYIESSPRNDRLVYLSAAEVAQYLDEIAALRLGTGLIGFTGGEPFMNPQLPEILDLTLSRGFRVLVLTNAMKPMHKMKPALHAAARAVRGAAAGPRLARPLRPRRARGGTRPAQLAADDRGLVVVGAQRVCRVGRDPETVGRERGRDPARLRRAVRANWGWRSTRTIRSR